MEMHIFETVFSMSKIRQLDQRPNSLHYIEQLVSTSALRPPRFARI